MEQTEEKKKTIATLRKERGWSQGELAIKASLSLKAVSRLETGRPVNKSTFALVCAALETSPEHVDKTGLRFADRITPGA